MQIPPPTDSRGTQKEGPKAVSSANAGFRGSMLICRVVLQVGKF